MRRYTYFPSMEDGEVFWNVYESSTDQIIKSFFFEEDAYEYRDFLERGGAFAGHTPSFMVQSVLPALSINEAFAILET